MEKPYAKLVGPIEADIERDGYSMLSDDFIIMAKERYYPESSFKEIKDHLREKFNVNVLGTPHPAAGQMMKLTAK
jgi:hypothetical protein